MELDGGRLRSAHPMRLEPTAEGAHVYFGQDNVSKGRWFYIEGFFYKDRVYDGGFMMIEFAASRNPNVPKRRHALKRGTQDGEFILLPSDHPIYHQGLWSPASVVHKNGDTCALKVIDIDHIILDASEAN